MAVKAGVGHSNHRNPEQAGKLAAEAALKEAGLTACDFVMMFATVGYDQQVIVNAVRKATGNVPLSGCSGEGVIAQSFGNESNHAVSLMVWKSDDLKFKNFKATGLKEDSKAVGASIATAIGEVPGDAQALFTLADGLTFNFDKFNEGFNGVLQLKKPLKMVGGTAGDNFTQTRTYQYHNSEVYSDGVSCAMLYGEGTLATDVSHGCSAIGAERTITKCEGNVIYEIDGKPATKVMEEYLSQGEITNFNLSMISLCLGFKAPKDVAEYQGDEYIIRVIPARDDAKGSISLYTEVKPGTKIWMTRRDPEKMMKGLDELIGRMETSLGGKTPSAVIQIECMGRGKNMFREEEKMQLLDKLQAKFGRKIPWVGFYAYGEIAPIGDKNHFHNYTSVVAAVA